MTSTKTRLAFIVIALGFVLRLIYVQFINPIDRMIYSDMANYISISNMLMNDTWRVSHFFQPIGYPLIISFLRTITLNWYGWLEWLQIISGTLTLFFVWKTAKETMGENIGLMSLLIASLHLPWIGFTGVVLAENLFILLLSILAWVSISLVGKMEVKSAALWALTFFLAFLLKGTHVFLVPLFILGLCYFRKNSSLKVVATIAYIVCLGLIAHGFFTKMKVDKFQMSASAGGLNFIEGKCPIKNNVDSTGVSWLSPLYFQLGFTQQKKWDRSFTESSYYMKEGFKCIADRPSVLLESFEGIPYLFVGNSLWPLNQTSVANIMRFYDLFFGCLSIIGLAGYFRFLNKEKKFEEKVLVFVLPILSAFICVYIFKSELRFRVPFDVWIIPVSVKGWSNLLKSKIT